MKPSKRTFNEIYEKALEIKKLYSEIEPKEWGAEQAFMGLVKDVGDLSKLIMISEGYREVNTEDLKKKMEHELADILFSVCVLADKLNVDLENSFTRTMDQLEQRIQENNQHAQ